MNRFFLSAMTFLISVSALTMGVSAKQVAPGDPIADLNGDGNVTLHEVVTFNRDQRNKR